MADSQAYDVAIIGGGIAGLSVALRLPDSLRIALFTKGQLGESNTRYAQGGLAVALGPDDNPELHFQDTVAAGAGHCNEGAVRILVEQAPASVEWLISMGVQFDRAQAGSDAHATRDGLLLGREAAHSRWRVLHAGGDATGAEIERALVAALRKRTSIVLYEETFVRDLLVRDGACCGVQAIDRDGRSFIVRSSATVLANGGAGGLWLHTSNPSGATADGLALAWRAGAALTDLEFMQFHPTVLVADGSSHLVSEAVRGEGAYLRNHAGERFMSRYHTQAELAPRDVVARAILSEMLTEQTECEYLDLRHLPAERMHARFPTISALCHDYGLDLAKDLLPVAPAAHYCMGGVMTDTEGRTTLPGLYAVGEVACTGVHGANRLASNSLLEGLVFGLRVGGALASALASTVLAWSWHPQGPHRPATPPRATTCGMATPPAGNGAVDVGVGQGAMRHVVARGRVERRMGPCGCQVGWLPPITILRQTQRELREIMWRYVSLCRDEEGLLVAKNKLETLWHSLPATSVMEHDGGQVMAGWIEMENMLQVAELMIAAALQRRESRGSHWRSDYDAPEEALATYQYVFQRTTTDLPTQEVLSHV